MCSNHCVLLWCSCSCSFSLRSLRDLEKGEELTITYGAEKPNYESLRDYGFVLAGNSHDRISWAHAADAKEKAGNGAGTKAEISKGSSMYGLNEACLMEVSGVDC